MKNVLSDEEYRLLVKKFVRASFASTDFFDKYEDILPVELLERGYKKRIEISDKYYKSLSNSMKNSEIK